MQVKLFETEAGVLLLDDGDNVIATYSYKQMLRSADSISRWAASVAAEKKGGITTILVSNPEHAGPLQAAGISSSPLPQEELEKLRTRRLELMVNGGLAANEEEARESVRQAALRTTEEAIMVESSRQDLHLVQAIQALDDLDRFLNIMTERVSEWYGLHFPELTQIIQDNLLLSKLVASTGRRESIEKENLEGRGLSDKKIEAVFTARDRSKGGTISERDISRLTEIADLAIKTSTYRDHMAEYVETTMSRIAPNVTAVAGATIGARLIAKAGGLQRLANLPASTVQILGAEKALFRALRTGARPPKHGIIFQHEAIHSAPKWQRGKIARALANKIAIAARIDYYRGESDKSLTGLLEKRLAEIRIKYKEPRPIAPQRKRQGYEKPPRGRKGRQRQQQKGRNRY